jgi:hypothetical protein
MHRPGLCHSESKTRGSFVAQDYEDSAKTVLKKTVLKLYVVGELSGDPGRWSRLSRRSLVIARTPEQALEMADFSVVCAEVDFSQPAVLSLQEGRSEYFSLAFLLEAAAIADGKASES